MHNFMCITKMYVSVCVCVCEREGVCAGEREKEIKGKETIL